MLRSLFALSSLASVLVLLAGCDGAVAPSDGGSPADAGGALVGDAGTEPPDAGPTTLTVPTASGPVIGKREGELLVFRRIPFAAPPTGERRFGPPAPVEPWTRPLDATGSGSVCLSRPIFGNAPAGREDCLHVNVWTPSIEGTRPVMVWVHGGAFETGSGSDALTEPSRLAREGGVVVVAINYRLGIFGSLAHPSLAGEGEPNGNWGVLDQQAALRWVRDNAAHFGGDPGNVTVFGHSAGGMSTCLLAISPGASGLAHRFIDQSGPCVIALRSLDLAFDLGGRVASALQCKGDDAAACLRAKDGVAVLNALSLPQQPGGMLYQEVGLPHRPTLDGVTFVEPPLESLRAGRIADASYVLGAATDEGTMFHHGLLARPVMDAAQMREALGRIVDLVALEPAQIDAIAARYPVQSYPSANDAITRATTDMFVCAMRHMARLTQAAGRPTYLYHFAQEPDRVAVDGLGVYHGADLIFLFGNESVIGGTPGSAPELGPLMRGYWSRFAASGLPAGSPVWPEWSPQSDMRLHLAQAVTLEAGDPDDECDFWEGLLASL
ncbi:MAG: carboxylesterase family protein [Sandaracinaceae bacterium]|nr:carboxylesterase family protein [Sandaracinaceae bacterium]